MKKKCSNCKYFSSGIMLNIPNSELQKLMKNTASIGECNNASVSTRICVSYGTICNDKYYTEKQQFIKLH